MRVTRQLEGIDLMLFFARRQSRAALTPGPSPGGRGEKRGAAPRDLFPSPCGTVPLRDANCRRLGGNSARRLFSVFEPFGRPKIAQRFIAGNRARVCRDSKSPVRDDRNLESMPPDDRTIAEFLSPRWGFSAAFFHLGPTPEGVGYCRTSLPGRRPACHNIVRHGLDSKIWTISSGRGVRLRRAQSSPGEGPPRARLRNEIEMRTAVLSSAGQPGR
jgi:hypothetical protein